MIFMRYFIYDANIRKHYLMSFLLGRHNDTLLVYPVKCHSFNHTIGMFATCFHNNHIKYLLQSESPRDDECIAKICSSSECHSMEHTFD